MKKLSLFVAMLIVITSFASAILFSVSADAQWSDSYKVVYSRDGSALMAAGDNGSRLTLQKAASLPQKGEEAGYYWSGTPIEDLTGDSHGKTFVNTQMPTLIKNYRAENNDAYPKYIVADFDVLFENADNAIGFRGKQTGGVTTTFFRITAGKDVNAKEWNHITAFIGANGTENTVKLYVNGVEDTTKAVSTVAGSCGFSDFGWFMPFGKKDAAYGAYFDNIKFMLGDADYENNIEIPEIKSSSEFTIDAENKAVNTLKTTKVSELLNSLTCTDGAQACVISDKSEIVADNLAVKNTYRIAVSKNNVFNYYSISYDADKLLAGWSGASYTSDFGSTGATLKPMILSTLTGEEFSINAAAPQKETGDTAIRAYSNQLSDNLSAGSMYLLSKLDTLIGKEKYKYVTYEYDVMFASENTGTFMRFKQYTSDTATTAAMNIYVGTGKSNMSVNSQNVISVTSVEPYVWNKVAMVFGADGVNDVCRVYVNGELAAEGTMPSGAYGVTTAAPNAYFSICGNKSNNLDLYLDNICAYAGSVGYMAGTKAEISEATQEGYAIDYESKTITPNNRTMTIADFKKTLTATENTDQIVGLKNNGSMQFDDDALLANCGLIALISTDGLWNYYTVDSTLKIDYYGISADILYTYSSDATTLKTYTKVANPEKNADVDVTTVIAFYNANGKIVDVKTAPNKTTSDTEQTFNLDVQIPEGASSFKIFVWDNFIRCMPLATTDKINIDDRLFFIFKFDDLMFDSNSQSKYDKWLGYLDNYGIHATAGAIANLFDTADLENDAAAIARAEDMKGWIEKGHEIWCHGYTMESEFGETFTKEQQIEVLDKSFAAIKKVLDYDMHVLGTPGNVNTDDAIDVINNYAAIDSVFMFKDTNNLLTKPNYEKIVYSEALIDGGTRVLSDVFESSFATVISSRTKDGYAITQIHPTWKNDTDFENFKVILNYLLKQNVCILTPSEYYAYTHK